LEEREDSAEGEERDGRAKDVEGEWEWEPCHQLFEESDSESSEVGPEDGSGDQRPHDGDFLSLGEDGPHPRSYGRRAGYMARSPSAPSSPFSGIDGDRDAGSTPADVSRGGVSRDFPVMSRRKRNTVAPGIFEDRKVTADIVISNLAGDGPGLTAEAEVDTGASHSWMPTETAAELGLLHKVIPLSRPVRTADGRPLTGIRGRVPVSIKVG